MELTRRNLVYLIGLVCTIIGGRLKARVPSSLAWEIGDLLEPVGLALMGSRLLKDKTELDKKSPLDAPK